MKKIVFLIGFLLVSLASIAQHDHTLCNSEYHLPPVGRSKKAKIPDPVVPSGTDVRSLQSNPGATAVLYMAFDGGSLTHSGQTFNYQASNKTDTQIYGAWKVVSEDFYPFNINVTTDLAIYNATAVGDRHIGYVYQTRKAPSASSGYNFGGFGSGEHCEVAGSMNWANVGEAFSHEFGHSMGLVHSSSLTKEYYGGHNYWAPIMGNNYTNTLTQWDQGEFQAAKYSDANAANIGQSYWSLAQKRAFYIDKTLIISTTDKADGTEVGFRTDDHGSSTNSATAMLRSGNNVFASSNKGYITEPTDLDFFSFTLARSGTIKLNANVNDVAPNLNIELKLYDGSGALLQTINDDGYANLGASLNTTLAAGTYYLSIDGAGEEDPLTTGYSDYGSLGYYSISGTIEEDGGIPNIAPIVSFITPTNTSTVYVVPGNNLTFDLLAEDSDGSISSITLNINGSNLTPTLVSGTTYSIDWKPLSPVEYTGEVVVTDNDGASSTVTTTFTVAWGTGITYDISYDANGGVSASTTVETVTENSTASFNNVTPSRNGYTFEEWNTITDGSGLVFNTSSIITGNITVFAQWEIIPIVQYTVSYDGNGNDTGTVPNSVSHQSGTDIIILNPINLSLESHLFTGWNIKADGTGDTYSASETIMITSDLTLYAMWELSTGLAEFNVKNIRLYPNPVTDQCYIHGIDLSTPIKVYNTSGLLVSEIEYQTNGIDLSNLINGIYFVSVKGSMIKVLVQ